MNVSFDQWSAAVDSTVTILKKRFPNLTTSETLKLAHEIVRSILATPEEVK